MRFRFLNMLYARINGYFWLPCPLCGKMFGGHESRPEWTHYDERILMTEDGKGGIAIGKCICPDCGMAGMANSPFEVTN